MASVAPEAVGWLAASVAGTVMSFTGAGLLASVRCASVTVRGDRPGTSAIDTDTLTRWLDGPPEPGRWPEELPFPVTVEKGPPAIAFTARKALSKSAREDLFERVAAWVRVAGLFPDPHVRGAIVPTPVDHGKAGLRVELALFGCDRLPFRWAPAEDLLWNVLRAAHHHTPLVAVTVARP